MQSSFLYLLVRMSIGYRPIFDILILLLQFHIKVTVHLFHDSLRNIRIIQLEKLDILRIYPFLALRFLAHLLLVFFLLSETISKNLGIFSFLLRKPLSPFRFIIGHYQKIQLVLIVVFLQQFLFTLEIMNLNLVLELLPQQSNQLFITFFFAIREGVVNLNVEILFLGSAVMEGGSRPDVTVQLLDGGLQPGMGTREHPLRWHVVDRTCLVLAGVDHPFQNNIIFHPKTSIS